MRKREIKKEKEREREREIKKEGETEKEGEIAAIHSKRK